MIKFPRLNSSNNSSIIGEIYSNAIQDIIHPIMPRKYTSFRPIDTWLRSGRCQWRTTLLCKRIHQRFL